MELCHVHVHSEFSFLDSCCRLLDLVKKARAMGMKALALTDHFNMSGSVEFYQLARKWGLKPLLGVEVVLRREEEEYHLVLLAKNNLGYTNLLHLVTRAHMQHPHSPHISWQDFMEYSAGLIALSGCEDGEVARLVQAGEHGRAAAVAREYQGLLGRNNFFLEILASFPRDIQKSLIKLSRTTGIPLIGSNDVHYLEEDQRWVHQRLLVLQQISRGSFPQRSGSRHFMGQEEMEKALSACPEALMNTMAVARRCNVTLDLEELHLPHYPVPAPYTLDTYLEEICWEAHDQRMKDVKQKRRYNDRLQMELDVIQKTGFAGYFLIVGDIIRFCQERGIPVQARGSAVGSYVGYLLGFSQVDPVAYNLFFERFLNPERVSMPDIDLDICHESRRQVLQYVRDTYGREHMAHISAYSTFAGRAAVHDAARALGLEEEQARGWSNLIRRSQAPLEESLALSGTLQGMYGGDGLFRQVFDLARQLERLPRHLTQHSAGIVLSRDPLTNYAPLQYSRDGETITQFDMHSIEALGLLKIDLLGSRFQSVIHRTVKEVQSQGREIPPIHELPSQDPRVYAPLQRGETMGIFQLESTGMRLLLRCLRPQSLADLIAATSLYRPGPLKSKMATRYIRRRWGKEEVQYPHPHLQPVLEETFGTILWQEQVMQTARVLAGYSLGEADLLRRATAKKQTQALSHHRETFLAGCARKGISGRLAEEIFSSLEHFSSYCFNKAHATAYAQLIYQTAYLKNYFPREYMASLMNMHFFDTGRLNRYLGECRRLDIEILPPHINESKGGFTVEKGGIRAGLFLIKQLGQKGVHAILEERQKGSFTSFHDFLHRTYYRAGIHVGAVESLIKAGAFRSLGGAYHLLWQLPATLQYLRRTAGEKRNLLLSADMHLKPLEKGEPPETQQLLWEAESTGHFLTCHPLYILPRALTSHTVSSLSSVLSRGDETTFRVTGLVMGLQVRKTHNGEQVYIVEMEDGTASLDIVFFTSLVGRDHRFFRGGTVLTLEVAVDTGKGVFQITARKILDRTCLKTLLIR